MISLDCDTQVVIVSYLVLPLYLVRTLRLSQITLYIAFAAILPQVNI